LGANLENLILNGTRVTHGTGNELANSLRGNGAANLLDGKAGADTLTGGLGSDTFVFGILIGGADRVTDFVSGTDKVQILDDVAGLAIGNGDHVIDNAALVTSGGFANTAELVVVSQNLAGGFTTAKAASVIGSATSNFALGDSRLFVVDNGKDSAMYLFKAADTDTLVSSTELTLVGTLQGAAQTALADYLFA
jgi:Ca2+-binding RTX toxin-like protein